MSLTQCLNKAVTLSEDEKTHIRRLRDEKQTELGEDAAAKYAVETVIGEWRSERDDFFAEIVEAGGTPPVIEDELYQPAEGEVESAQNTFHGKTAFGAAYHGNNQIMAKLTNLRGDQIAAKLPDGRSVSKILEAAGYVPGAYAEVVFKHTGEPPIAKLTARDATLTVEFDGHPPLEFSGAKLADLIENSVGTWRKTPLSKDGGWQGDIPSFTETPTYTATDMFGDVTTKQDDPDPKKKPPAKTPVDAGPAPTQWDLAGPLEKSKTLDDLREKLEKMDHATIKSLARGSGLFQTGGKAGIIDRLVLAREAAEVVNTFEYGKDFADHYQWTEDAEEKAKLLAWAEATKRPGEKVGSMQTVSQTGIVWNWARRAGATKHTWLSDEDTAKQEQEQALRDEEFDKDMAERHKADAARNQYFVDHSDEIRNWWADASVAERTRLLRILAKGDDFDKQATKDDISKTRKAVTNLLMHWAQDNWENFRGPDGVEEDKAEYKSDPAADAVAVLMGQMTPEEYERRHDTTIKASVLGNTMNRVRQGLEEIAIDAEKRGLNITTDDMLRRVLKNPTFHVAGQHRTTNRYMEEREDDTSKLNDQSQSSTTMDAAILRMAGEMFTAESIEELRAKYGELPYTQALYEALISAKLSGTNGELWGLELTAVDAETEKNWKEGILDVTKLQELFSWHDSIWNLRNGDLTMILRGEIAANPAFSNAIEDSDFALSGSKTNPPVVIDYEHMEVFATVSEGISYRFGMSGSGVEKHLWGDLVAIRPVPSNLPLNNSRISYWPKESNPITQRQITRNELKLMLGDAGPRIYRRIMGGVAIMSQEQAAKGLSVDASAKGSLDKSKVGFLEDLSRSQDIATSHGSGLTALDAELIIKQTRMSPMALFDAFKKGNYEAVRSRVEVSAKRTRRGEDAFIMAPENIIPQTEAEKLGQIEQAREEWNEYLAAKDLPGYEEAKDLLNAGGNIGPTMAEMDEEVLEEREIEADRWHVTPDHPVTAAAKMRSKAEEWSPDEDANTDDLFGPEVKEERAPYIAGRRSKTALREAGLDTANMDTIAEKSGSYKPVKGPNGKNLTQTQLNGALHRMEPAYKKAVNDQLKRRKPAESKRIKANLKTYKETPWAVVTLRGLVFRELMDRAIEGKDVSELMTFNNGRVWGKEDLSRLKMVKAFLKGEPAVRAFASKFVYVRNNVKAQKSISTSYSNCDPALCAWHCYAADGQGGTPRSVMAGEFIEYVAEKYPEILAEEVAEEYRASALIKKGLMLRLNDLGDLSLAQLDLVAALNAKGIPMQIFSKRPELLRQADDMNLKMLSIDTMNIDVAMANPDLRLAVTLTDDFPDAKLLEVADRVDVVLPVNLKGIEWGYPEIKAMLPLSYEAIEDKLCPVEANPKVNPAPAAKTGEKQIGYEEIVLGTAPSGTIVCTFCNLLGTVGCHKNRGPAKKVGAQAREVELLASSDPVANAELGAYNTLRSNLVSMQQNGEITNEQRQEILEVITTGTSPDDTYSVEEGAEGSGQGYNTDGSQEGQGGEGIRQDYGQLDDRETGGLQDESDYSVSAQDPHAGRDQGDLFVNPEATPAEQIQQHKDIFTTTVRAQEVGTLSTGIDVINSAEDAAHLFASIRKDAQESFMTAVTDADGKILRVMRNYRGTRDGAAVYPDVLVPEILSLDGATQVWFTHNHPTGISTPSLPDIRITERLVSTLAKADVSARHVIIGEKDWTEVGGQQERGDHKPMSRNKSVPYTERRLTTRGTMGEAVNNTTQAKNMIEGIASDDALVLMNAQNAPVGIVFLSSNEMQNLLNGINLQRVMKAVDKTNSSAAMLKTNNRDAAQNMLAMMKAFELRSLDWFRRDLSGNLVSAADEGTGLDGSRTFFMAEKNRLGLYSRLTEVVEGMKQKKGKPADFMRFIAKQKGVREDEIKWTGLKEYMDLMSRSGESITKDEILSFVQNNGVNLVEVVADVSGGGDINPDNMIVRDFAEDEIETLAALLNYDKDDLLQVLEDPSADDLQVYTHPRIDLIIGVGNDNTGYTLFRDARNMGDFTGDVNEFTYERGAIGSYAEMIVQMGEVARQNDEGTGSTFDTETHRHEHAVAPGIYEEYRELKINLPDVDADYYETDHYADRNTVVLLRVSVRDFAVNKPASGVRGGMNFKKSDVALGQTMSLKEATDAGLRPISVEQAIWLHKKGDPVYQAVEAEAGFNIQGQRKNLAERFVRKFAKIGQYYASVNAQSTVEAYFIEEFQSDWHQDADEFGYQEVGDQEKAAELTRKAEDMRSIRDDYRKERVIYHGNKIESGDYDKSLYEVRALGDEWQWRATTYDIGDPIWNDAATHAIAVLHSAQMQAWVDADKKHPGDKIRAAFAEASKVNQRVPPAPFSGDAWITLGLKRAIVDAIARGQGAIAWSDERTLRSRWGHNDRFENQYNTKMPSIAKRLTQTKGNPEGLIAQHRTFSGDRPVESFEYPSESWQWEAIEDEQEPGTWNIWNLNGEVQYDEWGGIVEFDNQEAAEEWIKEQDSEALLNYNDTQEGGYWIVEFTPELIEQVRADGFSLFTQTAYKGKGSSVDQVQKWIGEIALGWQNAPTIKILTSMKDLPPKVVREMKAQGVSSVAGYLGEDNVVYLVAGNIESKAKAQRALFHEAVGHFGVERLKGVEGMFALVQEIMAASDPVNVAGRDADIVAAGRKVDRKYKNLDDYQRSSEIIAHIAETNPQHTLVQKWVAIARKFFRDMGFTRFNFSYNDLVAIIIASKDTMYHTPAPKSRGRRNQFQTPYSANEQSGEAAVIEALQKEIVAMEHRVDAGFESGADWVDRMNGDLDYLHEKMENMLSGVDEWEGFEESDAQMHNAPESADTEVEDEVDADRRQRFIDRHRENTRPAMTTAGRKAMADAMEFDTTTEWYHATGEDLGGFDDEGFWPHFGTREQANNRLADRAMFKDNKTASRVKYEGKLGDGANIMPVYLRAKNPLLMDDVGRWNDSEVVSAALLAYPKQGIDFENLDLIYQAANNEAEFFEDRNEWVDSWENKQLLHELREAIEAAGYDSIRYRNRFENIRGKDGDFSMIVFNANQVRSVNAKFDVRQKDSPDIMMMADDESGTRKVRIKTDVGRLSKLLGPQLYGRMDDVGLITIKELFQNAFDGVKNNILQQGTVEISFGRETIVVKDNGSGMSTDTVENAFLTVAGTDKEGNPRPSGGFGIAKMLFLFTNKAISLVTVRDGVRTTLISTGADISAAADGGAQLELKVDKVDMPNGTTVTVTIPDTYEDSNTGDTNRIYMPAKHQVEELLENSPLFEEVDVFLNDNPVDIGSKFAKEDYTTYANVKFKWGNIRVITSKAKKELRMYESNIAVLSEGIYQFADSVSFGTSYPKRSMPYKFFFNLEPTVAPGEVGYPIALNRKEYNQVVRDDIERLKKYISNRYTLTDLGESSDSFGSVEILDATGKHEVIDLTPEVRTDTSQFVVNTGGSITVEEGRLLVDGVEVPELTTKEMKEFAPDMSEFKIEQGRVDPSKVFLHSNATLNGTPIVESLRQEFGEERVNKYFETVGSVFMTLRDLVHDLGGDSYKEIKSIPVGISFDEKYYGVHFQVPFRGMAVNPGLSSLDGNDATFRGNSIISTMIHEITHYRYMNHAPSEFISEMQRLMAIMDSLGDVDYIVREGVQVNFGEIKDRLITAISENEEIYERIRSGYEDGSVANSGSKLKSADEQPIGPPRDDDGAPAQPGAGQSVTERLRRAIGSDTGGDTQGGLDQSVDSQLEGPIDDITGDIKSTPRSSLTRRQFLKVAAATAASTALPGTPIEGVVEAQPQEITTSDAWVWPRMADGTYSNGDMVWDSAEQIAKFDPEATFISASGERRYVDPVAALKEIKEMSGLIHSNGKLNWQGALDQLTQADVEEATQTALDLKNFRFTDELPPMTDNTGQDDMFSGLSPDEFSQRHDEKDLTDAEIKAWRAANKVRQRQGRVPAVQQAAQDLEAENISPSDYRGVVKTEMPIRPLDAVPALTTDVEIGSAVATAKVRKHGILGKNREIAVGTRVASRLDIPAYDFYNTWVVTVHDGSKRGGNAMAYGAYASMTNVEFNSSAKGALGIATGKTAKAPLARIFGDWTGVTAEQARAVAASAMSDPAWVQVGMNPFRHSYFYDKATGEPVVSAEEVVQIGPLVMAKNVKKADPDDKQFQVGSRGVRFMADDVVYHVTKTENVESIKKSGVRQFETSNWVKGDGSRYGEGEIFSFDNKLDAIRWAANMDWDLNQESGGGKISIVEAKKGADWDIDDADPLHQAGRYGNWLKRFSGIPKEDILGSNVVGLAEIKQLMKANKTRFMADDQDMSVDARVARAKAQDFDTDTPYYRGSSSDETDQAQFYTKDPEYAGRYARSLYLDAQNNVGAFWLKPPVSINDFPGLLEKWVAYNHDAGRGGQASVGDMDTKTRKPQGEVNYQFADRARDFIYDETDEWIDSLVIDEGNGNMAVKVWAKGAVRSVNAAFSPEEALSTNILFMADDDLRESTVRDLATGDITQDEYYQIAGVPQSDFEEPIERWRDSVLRVWQDKFRPLLLAQKAIEKGTGRATPADQDAYRWEEAFYGKTEEDLRLMRKAYIDPLIEHMGSTKISREELDQYMLARHAEERNARIADINPDMQDGGSGITDQQARQIIIDFRAEGKLADLNTGAQFVWDMLAHQRNLIREAGLQDDNITDAWESMFTHYVPLRGYKDKDSDGNHVVGQGYDVRGKLSKRMLGRSSESESPLLHAINMTTEATIMRRKNEVGNALLKLVLANPKPGYWSVYTDKRPDKIRGMPGDKVQWVPAPMHLMKEVYFATKVDGVIHYIKLEDPKLMRAMKNMGPESLNKVLRGMNTITRFLSSVNTSYNPEFMLSNMARDLQAAVLNVLAEQDIKGGRAENEALALKMVKGAGPAIRAIHASLWDKDLTNRQNPDEQHEWQKYFDMFREDGAKTGWFDMKEIDEQAADLQDRLSMLQGGARGSYLKTKNRIKDIVEHANTAVENGVRLSAYRYAVEAGTPEGQQPTAEVRAKAASLAKNLTVNFNRKGEIGQVLNSLFMFANASIQGTATFARAMGTKKTNADGSKSFNVSQKTAMGLVAGAIGLALLNREMAGDDDDGENWFDKVPNHVRERNVVIMKAVFGLGEPGEYYTIPLPYGYSIFYVAGDTIEAAANAPQRKGPELATHLTMALLGSFSPIGFESSKDPGTAAVKTITPTVLTPFVQLSLNENFYGAPIYRKSFPYATPRPDSSMHMRTTNKFWIETSKFLNNTVGMGSDFREGAIDISPDSLEHLAEFGLGSMGAFYSRTINSAAMVMAGEEVETRDIAFLRKLSGKVMPYDDMQNFYDRKDNIRQIVDEHKSLRGKDKMHFRRQFANDLKMQGIMKSTDKQLGVMRKQLRAIETSSASDESKQRRMERIRTRMDQAVDRFNKKYNQAHQ